MKKRKKIDKLEDLAQASHTILGEISGVFPFTFFPDKLVIDMQKVEIHYWNSFFSKYVFPIPHEKLLTVKVHNGLLFSQMEFEVEGYEVNPAPVKFLPKGKAQEVRFLLIGISAAKQNEVDFGEIELKEFKIRKKLIEIGKSKNTST